MQPNRSVSILPHTWPAVRICVIEQTKHAISILNLIPSDSSIFRLKSNGLRDILPNM